MSEIPAAASDPMRADQILIALRRILRATELYERDLAQAAGLTPAKLRVLQLLTARPGGRATPTELSGQMGVSQATVTTLVDQLEKLGLATRHRSDQDRRQMHVVLAPAGTQALQLAPEALQQRFVRDFGALADWEQAMLIASLERVAGMLTASGVAASALTAPVLTARDLRSPAEKDG